MKPCEADPPEELLKALTQFNDAEYFQCHETLEELWMEETGEMRDFYQGLLQVAAALYHWKRGNLPGALSLLKGGAGYLARVSPFCGGVDVAMVVGGALRVHEVLATLGPERMAQLDRALIPVLRVER